MYRCYLNKSYLSTLMVLEHERSEMSRPRLYYSDPPPPMRTRPIKLEVFVRAP